MAKNNVTYTVEIVSRAFGTQDRIPWHRAKRYDGLNASEAIRQYNRASRDFTYGNSWSGHVRIVGSDDWTYTVAPPMPGERSTLGRLYHLDDI